jgi:zinc finger protein
MATVCDYCGHKTNEVKSGGGIESQGKKITLRLTEISDLSRDVLKVSINTHE